MKTLRFHFCHPVEGIIRFCNLADPGRHLNTQLKTADSELTAQVSVAGLEKGQWKAMLEWEYDGRDYFYEKTFEIKD